MSSINCPNCNSDNCQSFGVIHAHGTSVINTTTRTGGIGIIGGQLGVGSGKSHQSGVEQTQMGAFTAPPPKKSLKWKAIWMIIFFVYGSSVISSSIGLGLAGFILALITGYFLFKTFQYNATTWRLLYEEWTQKWLCNKCGSVFIPQYINNEVAATVHIESDTN